jgi:uncharacterized damage-inducible protein DinB
MMEELLFKQMSLIRSKTIQWIEAVNPAIIDTVPANFNNSIHWHVGHILIVQDRLTLRLSGLEIGLSETYVGWFGNGTKPADWAAQPPSVEILLQQLKEQTERIQKQLTGKLTDKLALPFQNMDIVGESLSYSLYHEGMHLGYMTALKRAAEA